MALLIDVDLYIYFGLEENCSSKEIKRAYRLKAKILHPDKNPNNPTANEDFQQLKFYFEILHNPVTKKEYDCKWKAKRQASQRVMQMDATRRKLKQDLETREAAAQDTRKRQFEAETKEHVANELRREWQVHTEEVKWQAMKKKKKLLEERNNIGNMKIGQALVKSMERMVHYIQIIKWDHMSNLQASACYTEAFLKTCLSEYGELLTVMLCKKGSGLAEFSLLTNASEAVQASEEGLIGLPNLPLKLSHMRNNLGHLSDGTKNGSPSPNRTEQQNMFGNSRDADCANNKPDSNSSHQFNSFESDILSRMANFNQ